MWRTVHLLTAILALLSAGAFASAPQAASASLEILDRAGRPVTRITDGNMLRLRLTLPSPVSSPQSYTFKLDDLSLEVGACSISSGSSCTTDAFPALGWHWDSGGIARDTRLVKVYGTGSSPVAQSAPVSVAPRPVVLVHGFVSSWDTWKLYLGDGGYLASLGLHGFAVGDGQVPGSMNVGLLANPPGRTNTIAQNAAVEAQYIEAVKQQTGAEMVDVIGHSMGGMISRYYIDRLMPDRDVAQLIMLGSPMGGSDCSVLPAALGFYLPASIEIRESYMRGVFNKQVVHRHGVPFYDLAGTAITKPFQSPCADVPNDIAVSIRSVNAIPLQSSEVSMLHTDLTSSREVFQQFVLPLLEKPAGSFASAPDPAPSAETDAPLPFTRVYTGHVAPGGATDLSITVDPNLTVASFALYDSTRSTTVSVRGASGKVLDLTPQANGFIQVKDPSSLVYLGYGFANPKPGIWHVSVLATPSTPDSGADFAISVYFVGGALLDATASTLVPRVGEQVVFSGGVSLGGQPLQITDAQAVIRAPDGKVEKLVLKGGASLSGSWTARSPGTYGVDLAVTALAPDGSHVERSAFLAEEVVPDPSALQVSTNLVLVIAGVAGLLGLIVFGSMRLFRRRPQAQNRG